MDKMLIIVETKEQEKLVRKCSDLIGSVGMAVKEEMELLGDNWSPELLRMVDYDEIRMLHDEDEVTLQNMCEYENNLAYNYYHDEIETYLGKWWLKLYFDWDKENE